MTEHTKFYVGLFSTMTAAEQQYDSVPETTADPYIVLYEDCDSLIHTSAHPFCSDESCPCHEDGAAFSEEIEQPIMDGLMTAVEGQRLFWGEML